MIQHRDPGDESEAAMTDERAAVLGEFQYEPSHIEIELDALRAENERLKAENASLKEANEIDLGEKAPLIFENTALSARVSELTRLLAEAESAIRFSFMKLTTHRMIRVIPDETWPDGWDEWHKSPAAQRALQSGEGKEPSR